MGKDEKKGTKENKIGRDAKTGQFIPVKEAEKRPKTTVVETVKKISGGKTLNQKPPKKR